MSVLDRLVSEEPLIDASRLDEARCEVRREPFAFLVAREQLPAAAADVLERDFPRYPSAGFFPYQAEECGPSVVACIEALTSDEFAHALGERLGIERLEQYPTLVTICRLLNKRHGTNHTDSRSMVATALLYLQPDWPYGSAGALRFLSRIDSIDAMVAPEVPPVYGTVVAFRRADNSFHGHLPFEGERRVIQVAWLTSLDEKERKTKRGRFSRLLKKVAGKLDAWWGSGRHRDAAHKK
jgi:hypothetical protein